MIYGYTRVSTQLQHLENQTYEIKEYSTSSSVSDIKIPANISTDANIICPRYATGHRNGGVANRVAISNAGEIIITAPANWTNDEFKQYVKGILLAYEKASS